MDSLVIFLVVFSAVVLFFAPHFYTNIGVLNFARYVAGAAPSLLDILGYIWNGLVSIIALMIFNIPGLELISVIFDALVAWVAISFIRGRG